MKEIMKRSLALLMALIMCLSLLPVTQLGVDAAEFEYVYDSTGTYIYNWGVRGETANDLSPNAEAFYTAGYTYDELAAYSGGTGTTDAPSSELYTVLQTLMKDAHSHETDYAETRDLYQYTDCQNSGGKISSFYSGSEIGPEWDSGSTWNREHTWPNSKGLAGNDENDIMMLRPTAVSENSSRSNKAYGKSDGYYNPNSASGGELDLRGDVARIFLYVYVRWGAVNGNGEYTTWGTTGVMESVDVLLEWMEADPVDTWELGRNDSVQSITGTRNVFVDYPELAFLLFGVTVPDDMVTPSGEAAGCGHNNFAGVVTDPTCTTEGFTTYTCQTADCGFSYKTAFVAITNHTYVDGACTVCGAEHFGVISAPVVGTAYKFGMVQENVSTTDVYYVTGELSGYYMDTTTDKAVAADVYLEETEGGYYLYILQGEEKLYINMVVSGSYVNGKYQSEASTVYTYDAASKTMIAQINEEAYWIGTRNDKTYTTVGPVKTSYNGFYCQLYGKIVEPVCDHTNTTVKDAKEATCTENGYTGDTVCSDCNATVSEGTEITAPGHTYVDGICSVCSATKPNAPVSSNVTISFADTANRTAFSTSQQVWEQNGITVTNDKASSTSNVADYSNPVRFYKSSKVTVAYPGMTKIEFACNATKYATALKDSIVAAEGVTVTVEGTTIIVEFASAQDSFEIAALSGGQVRLNSITVTAVTAEPECQHTNTTVKDAKEATCTTPGYTGDTVCSDCGNISEGTEIPATGEHAYVDGTCTGCGAADPNASASTTVTVIIADYADANGWANGTQYLTIPMDAVVTVTVSGGSNTGKYYTSGEQWRVYQTENPSIVVTAAEGKSIVSVKITYASQNTGVLTFNGSNVASGTVVDVNADSATFGVGNTGTATNGQVRITAIEVVYSVSGGSSEPECQHTNTTVTGAKEATCTTPGYTGDTVCSDCGNISEGTEIPATGEHTYVDGTCTGCGAEEPGSGETTTSDATYIMSDYKVDGELGGGEVSRQLDDVVTFTISSGWFTGEARIYKNANGVLVSQKPISSLVLNVGNKNSTFDVYVSEDGVNWTLHQEDVAYTTAYSDVTITFDTPVKYIKLDAPNAQLRIKTMTVTFVEEGSEPDFELTIPEAIELGTSMGHNTYTEEMYYVTGVITEVYNSTYGNMRIQDEEGNILTIYGTFNADGTVRYDEMETKPVAGDTVTIYGVVGQYNGTAQIKNGWIVAHTPAPCAHTNTEIQGAKDATCTENGHTGNEVCTGCGVTVTAGNVIPATVHSFEDDVCTGCGKTRSELTLSIEDAIALGSSMEHNIYTENKFFVTGVVTEVYNDRYGNMYITDGEGNILTIYGTYSADGSIRYDAMETKPVAGDTVTIYGIIGQYNGTAQIKNGWIVYCCKHETTDVVNDKEATCTENGYTGDTVCADCGVTITVGEEITAPGHTEEAIPAKDATCTETGLTEGKKCSVCGEILVAQEEIPVVAHALVQHEGKAPTCTENGWEAYETCENCDYTTYTEIAAGHTLVQHEGKAPTCTENGWEAYEACENCDYTTYIEIAAGHKYEVVVTAPTCTEGGFTTHTCSACGDSYVSDPVDALGHDMIHHEAKAPTCREKGWEEYEACSRCDHNTRVEIEATGHQHEAVDYVHEGIDAVIDFLDFIIDQLEWLEEMLTCP